MGAGVVVEKVAIGTKSLRLHKAIHSAQFEMRSVLTTDPFDYVDLWLRRNGEDEALFYWRQSKAFHQASQNLAIESAPLVLYYCFMNAAKALLSSKGVTFDQHHGVRAHQMRGPRGKIVLSNEGILVKNSGIVPALSAYFLEPMLPNTHSLEDVLYNLVFIHRTYCLSYPSHKERFLPLKSVGFVRDDASCEVFLNAEPVDDANWSFFKRALPSAVIANADGSRGLQSARRIVWATNDKPTPHELDGLRSLNQELRRFFHYINGAQTLWYLKADHVRSIDRCPITLVLSAMHRLSEICRYKPSELNSFLSGPRNWLLSEFVRMSPQQFLDEIACEMTGQQLMIPNVRAPV
ncbi:MAG: hypothetical protein B7Y73_02875 [Acidocella sp. 35-58-6]|nr:MAG: hypothetical protein B7Y73_02875 [Acidocella sp. 35-58-6]